MNTIQHILKVGSLATLLLASLNSCKKDQASTPSPVEINLPSELSLTFGERDTISLSSALSTAEDLQFKLDFSQTSNIEIDASSKLHDKLAAAITIDAKTNSILINSGMLYPNATTSSSTGQRIPDAYNVLLSAHDAQGTKLGEAQLKLQVREGKVAVKGANNSGDIPFAYVLYNDQGANFELDPLALPTQGSNWAIDANADVRSMVTVNQNSLQFAKGAGDPAQKAEQAYDLSALLQKNGFTVARTAFRVVFIPQIKFFFGTYYADMNLTIYFNLIHIGLSNGYRSSAPTFYPEQYRSTFQLRSVSVDGKPFENTGDIFSVDSQTGVVSVKKDPSLQAGSYKIMLRAISSTGLEFDTDLTLVMSEG